MVWSALPLPRSLGVQLDQAGFILQVVWLELFLLKQCLYIFIENKSFFPHTPWTRVLVPFCLYFCFNVRTADPI